MRIAAYLKQSQAHLAAAGIGTARLDTLVLLEDCTGRDRAWLLAHPESELSANQVTKLEKLLTRRALHEPLAYLRGQTEFYGRTFVLTPAVLEPRPESETMIALLHQLLVEDEKLLRPAQSAAKSQHMVQIADVGTGSGALGITAQLELPNTVVELLELDPAALKVAQMNVDKFTLDINVILSDLLEQSSQDYDILLCNLPYVPDSHTVNMAALHEPKMAIFGGPDGLDVYRKLFNQVAQLQKQPLYILSESLPPQHVALQQVAEQSGYKLCRHDDFIQVFERIQKVA